MLTTTGHCNAVGTSTWYKWSYGSHHPTLYRPSLSIYEDSCQGVPFWHRFTHGPTNTVIDNVHSSTLQPQYVTIASETHTHNCIIRYRYIRCYSLDALRQYIQQGLHKCTPKGNSNSTYSMQSAPDVIYKNSIQIQTGISNAFLPLNPFQYIHHVPQIKQQTQG
jgi:hypothetical protein